MGAASSDERSSLRARRTGSIIGWSAFSFLTLAPVLGLELGLTPIQCRVAGVTSLVAALWISVALPIGATSLLPAVLFPALGVLPAGAVAPLYMHNIVMLFVGAFIVALGLERWDVHRRAALAIVARVGTSPRRIVLGFMTAAAVLSMFINNTATTLLMLPIALAVVTRVEGEGARSSGAFAMALLLGVAYSSSVGGMGTPVGTAPNVQFLSIFERLFPEAPSIGFGEWFVAWAPLVLLFVPLGWLLMTRWVHPLPPGNPAEERAAADSIREERARQGPMTGPQRTMSLVFALTALLWMTRADLNLGSLHLPGWSGLVLGERASWVTDSTVALGMAVLCFLIPVDARRGQYLMDWKTAARLPWEVLLLLGSGLVIAEGFKTSGLDVALGQSLAPLFSGGSEWLIVFGVAALMCVLTEVTSNTATTTVLLPVVASAAVSAGISPLLVMAPATIAASAAFMLPVATPPNAVVFSSRRISVPQMARTGVWFNILLVVLVTLVFQLWVRQVWGIDLDPPAWALDASGGASGGGGG